MTNEKLFNIMLSLIPKHYDEYRRKFNAWMDMAKHRELDDQARKAMFETLERLASDPIKPWQIEIQQVFLSDWANFLAKESQLKVEEFRQLEELKTHLETILGLDEIIES